MSLQSDGKLSSGNRRCLLFIFVMSLLSMRGCDEFHLKDSDLNAGRYFISLHAGLLVLFRGETPMVLGCPEQPEPRCYPSPI
jgi:hypothetical protein